MYLHQDTQTSQCDTQHIVSMWCGNMAMLEEGVKWLSHHVVYTQYEMPTCHQQISTLGS